MSEPEVKIPRTYDVLFGHGVSFCCDRRGELHSDETHGFFVGDTRVLSSYRVLVNNQQWDLLGRTRTGRESAEWTFQNPKLRNPEGEVDGGRVFFRLKRRLAGALHDDYRIENFADRPVHLRLTIVLDADFSDIFRVKQDTMISHVDIQRIPVPHGLQLWFEKQDFRRGLELRFKTKHTAPVISPSTIIFDLRIQPQESWSACLDLMPWVDGKKLSFLGDPHEPGDGSSAPASTLDVECDPLLRAPFETARLDLRALSMPQTDRAPYLAAGVPWFLTLFGRDTLLTSILTALDGTWPIEGALWALAETQAKKRDDFHDAEPGKFLHERRIGELSHFRDIPHAAYYGAHDAPALFVLALYELWRWRGDEKHLRTFLEPAQAALDWCEKLGDRDGDGLLEYQTRSPKGYYNQSWKDSGDAIVYETGELAKTPLATVELQGYHYAARLAMSEIKQALGDPAGAFRELELAARVRKKTEEAYWMEREGFYALALDGKKRVVESVSSNPGHLLFCGLPSAARARLVAERLLRDDLFSGWGLRTLSAGHPAYNPLSYQLGSVWPHDTLIAAAGLWRYGHRHGADALLQAILSSAQHFDHARLPELFCGFGRSAGPPVPYEKANIPQAWAAAVPVAAMRLFLGIVPDAPAGRCFLQPRLPPWLPYLRVEGIEVGEGHLSVELAREGNQTVVKRVDARGIEARHGAPHVPLWGAPASHRAAAA